MRYLRMALAALCAATLVTVLAATTAGATTVRTHRVPAVARVSLVQGLPNTSVDVYLNGIEVVQAFRFKGVVGPLPLVPGHFHIALRLHGSPRSTKPFLSESGKLVAGENRTIVANLTTAGNPALTNFWNPRPSLMKGRAELVVRNVGDDPGLTVYADGLRIFRNLTDPSSGAIRLPAEWVRISMDDFGTSTVVIGPHGMYLGSQTVTVLYVIGNQSTQTLSLARQVFYVG